jgi:hypothetical protein
MSRIVSVATMLSQLDALRATPDLNQWEEDFVTSILRTYLCAGKRTSVLSGTQVEKIEQIWSKHFA